MSPSDKKSVKSLWYSGDRYGPWPAFLFSNYFRKSLIIIDIFHYEYYNNHHEIENMILK